MANVIGRRMVAVAAVTLVGILLLPPIPAGATTHSWTVQPTPDPGLIYSLLNDVSCTSATACTAVGTYSNASETIVTLAERWDGVAWSVQSTPNPEAISSTLTSVSCSSATTCMAVGSGADASNQLNVFAERWNETGWAAVPVPVPVGATSPYLNRVSCSSAIACTAVGGYRTLSDANVVMVVRWNGKAWTSQATPNLSGTSPYLSAVSCTSATSCVAVGHYVDAADAQATLAEQWDGAVWTVQPTPNPPLPSGPTLVDVSCVSPTSCTAVGYTGYRIGFHTLAEGWDGTVWTLQPTPKPPGMKTSHLISVSCTSDIACTAVGVYTSSSGAGEALAERWSGKVWSFHSVPIPVGAEFSGLNGVSCTWAAACTGVGTSSDNGAVESTLAERYS